jgi:hypothetical protein
MLRSLFTRRGATAVAVVAIGMSGMSLALAGTAGATTTSTLIVGSGSQTSYAMMTGLGDLFNNSPGCDLTASGEITLTCDSSDVAGTTGGEQGYNVAAENPFNDFTVQAPPVGSGNGRQELIDANAGQNDLSGAGTSISYARSSSGPSTSGPTDIAGESFVKYATDGVSSVWFNEVNGVKTAQAKVVTISQADLQEIYQNTLTCSVTKAGVLTNYTNNWICLGGKAAPIACYIAQSGSGTAGTWASAMGYNKSVAPPCTAHEPMGGTAATHTNLAENSMSYVSQQADAADALYFMSFGKYQVTCTQKNLPAVAAVATKTICAGVSQSGGGTYVTMGSMTGTAVGDTPQVPDKATIQGSGGGNGVTFPVTRGLYNVYLNSDATNPSNQATLNLVSEYGFLCKPDTASQVDPATGAFYRTEIEQVITANGFFPLDVGGAAFTFQAGQYPADITVADYAANVTQGTQGYCNVTPG